MHVCRASNSLLPRYKKFLLYLRHMFWNKRYYENITEQETDKNPIKNTFPADKGI